MPCHTRMKIILLRGLFWLYLMKFGFMVASLEPGFLDFDNLPDTNFSCVGKVIGGYYADLETSCQMFHVCTIGQLDEPMDIRFLCLNGTVFDQETRVCERIDEVDCSKSEQFYSLNLELYGNTQPPILEDTSDLEPTEILKQPSSSTTTSTTPRPAKPKTTRQSFIITTTPKPPTTTLEERLLQPHRFPGSNSADIRFNPEEINISLNPGAPPNIRPNNKPISFQQSINDNNKRVIVTTHSTLYKSEVNPHPVTQSPQIKIVQSPKPKPVVNYGSARDEAHNKHRQPIDDSYNYDSYQTEKIMDYESELSTHSFQFRPNIPNFRPSSRDIQHYSHKPEYKPSTYRSHYHPTTLSPPKVNYNHRSPTTYRNIYSSPLKPSIPYYHRTEKPPRIQLPVPMIPTLSPLTFSSPAPFSLNRHVESKRFADHHQPPRIVISASASVSDASGRKFNYSLGTIGDSRLFSQAPNSYDEYKEEHVGLDPFYHDVPKLTRLKRNNYYYRRRYKRSTLTNEKNNNVTRTRTSLKDEEKEAIDVLKFLFDWYSNYNKSTEINIPIDSESITEINDELTPSNVTVTDEYFYEDLDSTTKIDRKREYNTQQSPINSISNLQIMKPPKKDDKFIQIPRRYNVSEGIVSVTEIRRSDTITPIFERDYNSENYEYVDDNYEPQTYNENLHNSTTEYYDYEEQEIPTITTENTRLNKTLKNQTETYDNVLKILGITTNNPVKNTTDKIIGTLNKTVHFSLGNKTENYYQLAESNVNKTRNHEQVKQYSDDVIIYDEFEIKNNNYEEQYYEEQLGDINTTTSSILKKNEELKESNKNYSSVAYEKFLEKHSSKDTISENSMNNIVKELSLLNYEKEATISTISEIDKYETTTEMFNTTSENITQNTISYSTMPTIIVTDPPTTRLEETIITTELTTPVDTIPTDVTIPTSSTIDTTIAKIPFETTTLVDYTTQYFTTENIMITSVQLQKFIEGVETETKSIVDSKSVSDATTEVINATPTNFESKIRERNKFKEVINVTPTTLESKIGEESNKLMEAMIQTTSIPTTTEIAETSTTRISRTRNSTRRNSFRGSHRFGSSTIKPQRRKPSITEEIVDVIKNKKDKLDELKLGKEKIEFNINAYTANLAYRNRNGETTEEISVTAPSFSKSANPTLAKEPKDYLSTTPISKSFRLNVHRQIKNRNYVFNCFGRDINKFYSDPRDCRLFHYCTQGFTKTQLLDMKFVCDLGTYFDNEKLICTKIKPSRCT